MVGLTLDYKNERIEAKLDTVPILNEEGYSTDNQMNNECNDISQIKICQIENDCTDDYVEERREDCIERTLFTDEPTQMDQKADNQVNKEHKAISQIKNCQIEDDCIDNYEEEGRKKCIERTLITDEPTQTERKLNEELFSNIIDFKTHFDEYFDEHMLCKTIKMCEGYCIDFFEPSNNKTKCYFNNLLFKSKQKHSLISNESKQKHVLISNELNSKQSQNSTNKYNLNYFNKLSDAYTISKSFNNRLIDPNHSINHTNNKYDVNYFNKLSDA